MGKLKKRALDKARKKYGRIYPCGSKKSLYDCFSFEGDSLYFWFNSEDRSTHVVQEPAGLHTIQERETFSST